MLHALRRRLGRGSVGRLVALVVLLAGCGMVAASVLSSAIDDRTQYFIWNQPAGDSHGETEVYPPVLEAPSGPPGEVVRPPDEGARTDPGTASPGGGAGSVGFLGLLVIVVVAIVLFHLLQNQDRDRR